MCRMEAARPYRYTDDMKDTFYCHGLPGGAAELELAGVQFPVLDRRDASAPKDLIAQLPMQPVHLIGFSLGAALALRLAAEAPDRIGRLTLISAAAPLELGQFLPDMAGRWVFRMARCPRALGALLGAQGVLARRSPDRLASMLRATCDASDTALFGTPQGRESFHKILQQGYGPNRPAARREIAAYVRPWADILKQIQCPVTLHHGTSDQWSPPAMAGALHSALPSSRLIWHNGLGHYATLVHTFADFTG